VLKIGQHDCLHDRCIGLVRTQIEPLPAGLPGLTLPDGTPVERAQGRTHADWEELASWYDATHGTSGRNSCARPSARILLESLPPLHEEALTRAGEQLDGLTENRAAQERLEHSSRQVAAFLGVYQRYATDTPRSLAGDTLAAAGAVTEAESTAGQRAAEFAALAEEAERREAAAQQLAEELTEIDDTLKAMERREIFKTADDLVQRDRTVSALAEAAEWALAGAGRERANHERAVDDAGRALGDLRRAASDAGTAPSAARGALTEVGLPAGSLPGEVRRWSTPGSPDRPCCAPTATATRSRSPGRPPHPPTSSRPTSPPRGAWPQPPGPARRNGWAWLSAGWRKRGWPRPSSRFCGGVKLRISLL
jgi:hypothetical protein